LYGPQESHPVAAGTLDCETAAGSSFWESIADDGAPRFATGAIIEDHAAIDAEATGAFVGSPGGERMAADPGRAGSNEERTVSYQPEERYWTDYLRIALPVVGLLILIGLLWYWASALIGDGANQPPPTADLQAVITPINESTPAPPTPTAAVIAPTAGPPPTATPTAAAPAAVATQPVAAPTTPPESTDQTDAANPCANMPLYEAGAVVTTTAEVNLRPGPSTDGDAITTLPQGTQLQVTGAFSEAGQCDWWPVTVTETGQAGFIREDFLQAAAS
jgi:hypothetical protein